MIKQRNTEPKSNWIKPKLFRYGGFLGVNARKQQIMEIVAVILNLFD